MKVTRGHLLLGVGLLAGGGGLAVIFAPDLLPPEIEQFRESLDAQLVSRFAMGLGGFVVLVSLYRLLRPGTDEVDRSPIAQTPPEIVTADEAADADRQTRLAYSRALKQIAIGDHNTRLVAIYGRRAQSATEIDEDVDRYLQQLAAVVAKTYATSVGCDESTATRAVETGQWTDDRIAAAFLATDLDSEVSFTAWERFNAWLAPERVFQSRVQRVLGEAEVYTDTYLTYGGVVGRTTQASVETEAGHSAPRTDDEQLRSEKRPNARADGGDPTSSQHAPKHDGETR